MGKPATEQILSLMYWENLIVMKKTLTVWLNAGVDCFLILLILCFASPVYGIDINLRWDPNVEPDLSGYRIYYKTGSPGPPYNGWGALEGDSPIAIDAYQVLIGDACEFTIRDLDETKAYYFVVTAYDTEWNESDYSNEVCFNCRSQYDCILTPNTFVIPRGEKLGIDVTATNKTDQAGIVYFTTKVTKPNGQLHPYSGYLLGPVQLYLEPYASKLGHISHTVPMDWPLGYNVYHGYVGIPGVGSFHECQFVFEVIDMFQR